MKRQIVSALKMKSLKIAGGKGEGLFIDILVLTALFAVLYLALSFMRPLASPDEGRYSQIPIEMVKSGDYVSPRLNEMVYFYKPPLFYWMQAASIKAFGVNRVSLRLPNSLMAILGILATYCAARVIYGRKAGLFSAFVLGTSVLYFALGEIVTLDMTVSVFIGAAMFSFIVALKRSGLWRGVLILSFFAMCALAVMTKGIIGVLIPCAVIFLFAAALGFLPFFKMLKVSDIWWCAGGAVLFLAIAVPWHVMAALANPPFETAEGLFSANPEGQGFLWYYIVHEHILRYVDPDTSMRAAPWWTFVVLAPVGLIPWVVLLPQSVWDVVCDGYGKLRSRNPEMIFLGIWILFVIAFFSVSSSKLPAYILPIYPAFAVIVGVWVAKFWDNPGEYRMKAAKAAYIFLGCSASIAPVVLYAVLKHKGKLMERAPEMLSVAVAMSVAMAVCTAVSALLWLKRSDRGFWTAVFAGIYVLLMFFNPIGTFVQRESAQALAEKALENRMDGDAYMVAYNYNEFQDFPVWLGRTVYMVGNPPEEQKFGFMREREKNSGRFITEKTKLREFVDGTPGNVYIATDARGIERLKSEMGLDFSEVARSRNLHLLKATKK